LKLMSGRSYAKFFIQREKPGHCKACGFAGKKRKEGFMKKALLIVAMLLLVTPVMAATTITAVQGVQFTASDGNKVQPVSITYSSDVNIRAFALDINIASDGNRPNFQGIRNFKTGESNAASPGYGIFPSRFRDFIVVTGPNWVDPNYNPTTAWNEPETTSHTWGMGYPQMIVEMGTLYAGDANKPALSGTLFTFDVNAWGAVGTFHLAIAADALRGGTTGVIGNDGNSVTPVSFVGTDVVFAANCITIPNIVNAIESDANNTLSGAGLTGPIVIAYANSNTVVYGHVISQDTGCVAANATIHYVASAGCFPMSDPNFSTWVSLGKPHCWCFPRQCHGDADGLAQGTSKQGYYYVGENDLNILLKGWKVLEPTKGPGIQGEPNICADFAHDVQGTSKQGYYRVGENDLNKLLTYWKVLEPTKGPGTPANCGGTLSP
jgi:hypothetical protein